MEVLIVCEDAARTQDIRGALEQSGHQVESVGTPAEGLSRAGEAAPDLIILSSTGDDTAKELKEFRASVESHIPERAVPVLPARPQDSAKALVDAITRLAEKLAPAAQEEVPDDSSRTLLLVEDKEAHRRRLMSQFQNAGWTVIEVEDTKTATLKLIDNAVDCVMVSAMLSGKTSHGFVSGAAEIRKGHPNPYTILVMVDVEDSDSSTRMLDHGADDIVGRSMGAAALMRRMHSALSFRRLLRENRRLKERIASLEASAN